MHTIAMSRDGPPVGSLNWTNILFFSAVHLAALPALWYLVTHPIWQTIALGCLWYFLRLSAIAFGYHKYYNHESYKCALIVQLYYLVFGAGAYQNAVAWWSPKHTEHHSDTDGPRDPHSIKRSFWHAHCGWLMLHHAPPPQKLVDKIRRDPLVRWQEKWIHPLAFTVSFLLPTLIGLLWSDPIGAFAAGGIVSLVFAWHQTWWVNSGAHYFGDKPYNDRTTATSSVLAVFCSGMSHGYGHNFHHTFCGTYYDDPRPYAWDPAKWWARGLETLGLAWDLRSVPAEMVERAMARAAADRAAGKSA